jgi:hypothetical protein
MWTSSTEVIGIGGSIVFVTLAVRALRREEPRGWLWLALSSPCVIPATLREPAAASLAIVFAAACLLMHFVFATLERENAPARPSTPAQRAVQHGSRRRRKKTRRRRAMTRTARG